MKKSFYLSISLLLILSSVNYCQVYNWFPVNSGTTNNLNCIYSNFICGANGTVLTTSNYGNSWYSISAGTNNELTSIAVSSATNILIVGANGTILRSTNSGANWNILSSGLTTRLNSISRASNNNFIAVGAGGKIITTSNMGDNWTVQFSGVNVDLNCVSCFAYYGWAAGNNGTILFSTNWGVNWTPQSSGLTTNLNSIIFTNLNTGWAVGDNSKIIKTTNGGLTWNSFNIYGISTNWRSVSSGIGIAGDSGKVLTTTNGGLNWNYNVLCNNDINSIYSYLWAAGKNGVLYNYRFDSLYNNWKLFYPNNTGTIITNTGIFNQDIRYTNHPGFEWPAGSGKYAIFSMGLCVAAMVNGQLREAMASYKGEYKPGYIADTLGGPQARTDNRFRIYIVKRGDNAGNNQNWAQWGQMVPFGAPYVDVNQNNQYEPAIDTPGVSGAYQTVFMCLTDGFPETHIIGEGFGGGTSPLFAEVHVTAWGYNYSSLEDVQFIKWDIINKGAQPWNSTYFSIVADPDLGNADDDYIGCDTTLKLGFCYNGDDNDEQGQNTYNYGLHPPAVGFLLLENAINKSITPNVNLGLSSFTYCNNTSAYGPFCETDPNAEQEPAYNMMKGLKKDLTPWVIPPGGSSNYITKFCYSGDPETGTGWNEGFPGNTTGSIWNCGGPTSYNGELHSINTPGDRRLIISSGAENFTVLPGEKQVVAIAQYVTRGTNNLNSVTLLKSKAQTIRNSYLIGVREISENIPSHYFLYQNYPNPFNPSTRIKFSIPKSSITMLIIYDLLGKEVTTLVHEQLKAGEYKAEWNGSNYSSGIYFYKLITPEFTETKRMVLIK